MTRNPESGKGHMTVQEAGRMGAEKRKENQGSSRQQNENEETQGPQKNNRDETRGQPSRSASTLGSTQKR